MNKYLYCLFFVLGLLSPVLAAEVPNGQTDGGPVQIVTGGAGEWERHSDAGKNAYRQRRYSDAQREFLTALQEAEKFGLHDPRLARTLNDLASVYSTEEKYAEAEPLYRRALKIDENARV